MTDRTSADLRARVARLESSNRRLKVGAALGLGIALCVAATYPQSAEPEALRAESLRIVHDGMDRIVLDVDAEGQAGIRVLDPDGTLRFQLGARPGGSASFELRAQDGSSLWHVGESATAPATGVAGSGVEAPLLEMRIVAKAGDDGVDLANEAARLRAWLEEHPEARTDPAAIGQFHALPAAQGGPAGTGVRWYPHWIEADPRQPERFARPLGADADDTIVRAFETDAWNGGRRPPGVERLLEYVPLSMTRGSFGAGDLDAAAIEATVDHAGRPAVRYRMRPARVAAFADWSDANANRAAAIVLDGRVVSAPRFMGRIVGSCILSGDFTDEGVKELTAALRQHAGR